MNDKTMTLEPPTAEAGKPCDRPGCASLVDDWDPRGRLCATCSLDAYLYDREARWDALAESAAA